MEKNTRKSSALISLVLVPLNLMGLGFIGGCDSRDDDLPNADFANASDQVENPGDATFEDPDDPYNLDPVQNTGGPTTQPSQTVANSSFSTLPPHVYYHTSGVHFIPIPYRTGYQPMLFRPSTPFRSSPSSVFRSSSGSSFSRSSSSFSHGSGTSRGGFGSHAGSISS